jgi:hypothetical protein
MTSAHALISRLQHGLGVDRRLDSEVIAYVMAPAGCRLDPVADIDGWAILAPSRANGEGEVWMMAADVPGVTASLDFVQELMAAARPLDGAQLMARAFHRLSPVQGDDAASFAGRAARAVLAELVGALAAERGGRRRSPPPRAIQDAIAPRSQAA